MDHATYGQLTVFHAIAQEQSITAASRRLGVTVPSVSKSLRQLEHKIGVPLFQRTTRKISLTEAGRQLLERTESAMKTLDLAVSDVLDLGKAPSGLVRITLARVAYDLVIRPKLAAFCQAYPQIQLEISIDDATINLVESHFDLGIRFGDRVDEGMVAKQAFPAMKIGLYASQAYLKQHGTPQTPQDLHKHQVIGYRFSTSQQISPLVLIQNNEAQAFEAPMPLIYNDIEAVRHAVSDGIAIGRLFEPQIQRYPDNDLQAVLEPFWQTFPPLYFYFLQNSQRAKRVQAVIEFFTQN